MAAARSAQKGKFDSVEQSNVIIDIECHMVHEGYFFEASDYDSSVDTGSPKYYLLKAPNTATRVHLKIEVSAGGAAQIQLLENPTVTDNGVAVPIFNMNRNSNRTAETLIYADPTATDDGTQLQVNYFGSTKGATRIGGTVRWMSEWILKQGEDYLIKSTVDIDATKVSTQFEFYEVK